MLFALILLNATLICAAAMPVRVATAHSCCPVSPDDATNHCGKLGCFMSAPAVRAEIQSAGSPAWIFTPAVTLASPHAVHAGYSFVDVAASCADLPITFHQLLI